MKCIVWKNNINFCFYVILWYCNIKVYGYLGIVVYVVKFIVKICWDVSVIIYLVDVYYFNVFKINKGGYLYSNII